MLQLVERTIVRYACWARLVSQHMLLQVLGQLPNNCEVRSPTTPVCPAWPAARSEQLFVLTTPSRKNAEQKKKKEQRHGSLGNSDTEQVRKSEPDNPTGQARPSTPHRTHQVLTLFCGRYAIMFYRLWVVMGLCGYFHAFLCNILKFL